MATRRCRLGFTTARSLTSEDRSSQTCANSSGLDAPRLITDCARFSLQTAAN